MLWRGGGAYQASPNDQILLEEEPEEPEELEELELMSKELKTTGHTRSTYIRQGPLALNPAIQLLVRQ